jgi:hypothetical protein
VILGDTQIHLGISNQREAFAGFHYVTLVLHPNVLEREFLLVEAVGANRVASTPFLNHAGVMLVQKQFDHAD